MVDVEGVSTRIILDLLKANVMRITFVKNDGSLRVMLCTLLETHLPKAKSYTEAAVSDTTLTVWDVESNGWRSICLDSLVSVESVQ